MMSSRQGWIPKEIPLETLLLSLAPTLTKSLQAEDRITAVHATAVSRPLADAATLVKKSVNHTLTVAGVSAIQMPLNR